MCKNDAKKMSNLKQIIEREVQKGQKKWDGSKVIKGLQ